MIVFPNKKERDALASELSNESKKRKNSKTNDDSVWKKLLLQISYLFLFNNNK